MGTVYKHFPTLDDLLPACGALMMERYRPPQPDDAHALAGTSSDETTRLAAVVAAVFSFYERAGPAAEIDGRERKLAAIQEWEHHWADTLAALVEVALGSRKLTPSALAFVTALLDQRTYAAMAARGIGANDAAAQVSNMIAGWLGLARLRNAQPMENDS